MQLTHNNFQQQVLSVTQSALDSGALKPIATQAEIIEDSGVRFLVRYIDSLQRKKQADDKRGRQPKPDNPFLPYEPAMYVGDLGHQHVCLLNKFNVVGNHVLMVTKHYESQDQLLTREDLAVALTCLQWSDGLVFYNGGRIAGASQHHKHLQMIPLPITEEAPVPLLDVVSPESLAQGVCGRWPFAHALYPLPGSWLQAPNVGAEALYQQYIEVMQSFGLAKPEKTQALGPYNFLMTRDYWWCVPRSQEGVDDISLNSLAYAGALLVKTPERIADVQTLGPLNLLARCAGV